MAQQEPDSMIGYDPLAWMAEAFDEATDDATATFADHAEPTDVKTLSHFEEADDACIVLDNTLNIQSVTALHERFLQAIDQMQEIVIDASQVEQIDTANLQLLLILKQECVKLQKKLRIDVPSERFVDACQRLGLDGMLDIA